MNQPKDKSSSSPAPDVRTLLRSLPAATELLAAPELKCVHEEVGHGELLRLVQQATGNLREKILASKLSQETGALSELCVKRILSLHAEEMQLRLGHVINATGVLLHTNLGRAPLAERARKRMADVAGYSNVELNLTSGRRSGRGERVTQLLARLTGAESALIVNNCAAATMLALAATSRDRETIISRSQLVEIGGGFRLPEVFEAAGAILREIGTTNRTYTHDYTRALSETTGAILRVHRSNFSLDGFVAEPDIVELAKIDVPDNVAIIDDIGSGCLHDLSELGLVEPNARESVAAGADLVLFSGDKLFGGPQAGIIVGKRRWIDILKAHPMMRAMRVDKTTLAGIEATCEIHLSGRHREELPLYAMMHRTTDELAARAQAIADQLASEPQTNVSITEQLSTVGGGTLPGFSLPSWAVQIAPSHGSVDALSRALRQGIPAVQARVQDGQLLLDMRSVLDEEAGKLVSAVTAAIRRMVSLSQGSQDAEA